MVATGGERPANFRGCPDTPGRAAAWWAPPGTPARALERTAAAAKCARRTPRTQQQRRRLDDLRGKLAEVCAGVLDAGLRHRAGRYLVGVDHAVHDYLADGCPGHRTRGVSVCEVCARIFTHAYTSRARCDTCHARPSRPAAGVSAPLVIVEPAGGIMRWSSCEHCAELHATKLTARFCGERCRKRHASGVAPPEGSHAAAAEENAEAIAEIRRLEEVARREQEEVERRDPALRAARLAAQQAAETELWRKLAMSPVLEQLATTGTLKDTPGYEPEPDTYRPRQRPCRECAREGPWLSVCGPCGDPQAEDLAPLIERMRADPG